jgi:ABC-type transport system involved in cytochrome bd biosynthesis fused ATPase/permease subunit
LVHPAVTAVAVATVTAVAVATVTAIAVATVTAVAVITVTAVATVATVATTASEQPGTRREGAEAQLFHQFTPPVVEILVFGIA